MDGLDWSRYDDQEIDYDTGEWRAVSPTNQQRNEPKGSQIRTIGGATIGAGGVIPTLQIATWVRIYRRFIMCI